MSNVIRKVRTGKGEALGYSFTCPGCGRYHVIPVEHLLKPGGPKWTFNGDMARPTFSPSVLAYRHTYAPRCHFFLRDGQIKFLGDSGHALAGKTVPLAPVEDPTVETDH
jgi:hypothetical protein